MLLARLIGTPLRVHGSSKYRFFPTNYIRVLPSPSRREFHKAARSGTYRRNQDQLRTAINEEEAGEMASSGTKKVVTPSSLVNCHLQVIGTGHCEVSPSLCLFTDSRRYIFNCPENFQRFTREYRMKILKDPTLFVTRVCWRNLGGLPGFAMSYRDCGRTHLHVHGPGRIAQFAEVTRYFIGRERLKLMTNWEESTVSTSGDNSTSSDIYTDENITITTIELEPQLGAGIQRTASSLDDGDVIGENVPPKPKRIKLNSDSDSTSLLPPYTAAFVCKLVDTKGKFNPERAKELGLKQGPVFKKLVAGESVTAPDGRVIHPSDVIGEKQVGPTLIVVECPDKSYIPCVASHPKLQKECFSDFGQNVALIVHLSPLEVLEDDDYCRWAASFGDSTRHLVLNESLCPKEVGLRALMKIQYPLHLMNCNVHHPPPNYKQETEEQQLVDLKLTKFLFNSQNPVIIGKSFLKFHLKPIRKMGEDMSDILRPIEEDIIEHIHEIQSNPKLASAIAEGQSLNDKSHTISVRSVSDISSEFADEKAHPAIADKDPTTSATKVDSQVEKLSTDPRPLLATFQSTDDAVVTFLGTGASLPSRYRNVSGILVQTPNSGSVLLDCGEGSLSQIYRCFPRKTADEIILNLKAIFISHIHGDHHLGLVSILQKKEQLLLSQQLKQEDMSSNCVDMLVIAPKYNINWMNRYGEFVENLSCKTVDCSFLTRDQATKRVEDSALSDFSFETVPVIHCSEAYGVVVRHTSGWSIVYSGDTRPCPTLVEAGRGATLLIHEATLEDGLLDHAIAKKHCTVSEALEVSDKMEPDFTILTHFSQRYPKIPAFLMADQLHSKVAVAFDCMSVNLKQLDTLHKYLPAMRDIFAEVVDTDSEEFEYSSSASNSWDFAVPS